MAHNSKIVYVQSPFVLRWFRLDMVDVMSLCNYIRCNFDSFPENVQQTMLNVYDSLQRPKNPRNIKLV